MSGFLYRLGRACYRHHWRTLLIWLAVLLATAGTYALAHGEFNNDFELPGSQSMVALDQLKQTFPQVSGTQATMIVVAADGHKVDDPEIKAKVQDAVKNVGTFSFVNAAVDPYDPLVAHSISDDHRAGLTTIRMPLALSAVTDAQRQQLTDVATHLQSELPPGSTVRMGGEVFGIAMPSVSLVEAAGVGVALIVLIFTLGSFLAAAMPIGTAVFGAGISVLLMMIATRFISVLSASPMLSLMLGLAVGIDYALFILSRHRDQLRSGLDPEESTARAVATAGSAVVFAGATVVIALLGLFVVGIPFLATMGFFAAVAVALAVAIALTALPALMGAAGSRLIPKHVRQGKPGRRPSISEDGSLHGASAWWVGVATKFPILTVVVVVAALGALALPARHMELSLPNAGQHSRTAPERQTFDLIANTFGPGYNGPMIMTATLVNSNDPVGLMKSLKEKIEAVPGVATVPLATPNQNADTGIVQIIPTTGPDSPQTVELVKRLRDLTPQWEKEYGTHLAVTGSTAVQIDVTESLGKALLPFGIFVVGLSVILLTMVFRSLFVPITAALGYVLSVLAAFGATSLVFNDGIGRGIVNLEDKVPIISFFPIIFMGILFGLAMDYEVFLVSRMREEHVHGMEAKRAVKVGFVHSAKVVVAAALIMFSVFAFFVPHGDTTIKPIAFGLAVGVAIDAFLVRMTLIPAVMTLAGERAWWLPKWLDKILPSFDVEGEGLAHQLALADWPQPHDTHVVYAEDLTVHDGKTTLLAPTSIAAQPGETVVVEGEGPARAALLLALAGKLPVDGGEAKINQAVLTTQAGEVRRAVTYVDRETPNPAKEFAAGRALVLVDDLDLVAREHPHAVADLFAGLGRRAAIVGAADARLLEGIVPDGARRMRVGWGGKNAAAAEPVAALAGLSAAGAEPAAVPAEHSAEAAQVAHRAVLGQLAVPPPHFSCIPSLFTDKVAEKQRSP